MDPDEIEETQETFMYFIKKGKFSVYVKTDWNAKIVDDSEIPAPVNILIDNEHFGEIGMIYECKRTSTIISVNYGSLARLTKSSYVELSKNFEMFQGLFKQQTYKYNDDLTVWLTVEMNKIGYFRQLSLQTKAELIYGMERKTFEENSLICKKDDLAEHLILIQDGIVEVKSQYDKRRENEYFVIERLGRGAIINHRSFMIGDEADTDFSCKTVVSAYLLPVKHMKAVKNKRQDLKKAKEDVKKDMYDPLYPLALDYIFHNNDKYDYSTYLQTLRRNQLKVKFKNAIMQHWTKIKEEN